MNMSRLIFAAALCGICLPELDGGKAIDVTRAIHPNGEVRVSSIAGEIKVRGWNKPKVHISGQLAEQAKRLDVNTDATGIDIKVIYPHFSHGNFNENEGSHLTIAVPRASSIKIDTVSADVDANGVRGRQRLKSTSGDITLHSKSKDISVQSVSGDERITGSAPSAHIEAGSISGNVSLSNITGELAANSVSGDVSIDKSRLTRASLKSTSGDVDFTGALAGGGQYDFHTISGRVTLRFPEPPNARFDISTFSGEIDNSFGPKPKKSSPYTPASELSFVSGKGGATVNIDTLSGRVELRTGGS
jgi:DUF4097 and DUF4098 domain-containing protein YvlB